MSGGLLLDAVSIGLVYALIALGFTIIFAPTRVINFAQAEFMVLGAAGAYQLGVVWGWHPILVVLGVVLLAAVMALLLERMVMLPQELSGSRYAWIIATLAAAIIFQAGFVLTYPSTLFRTPPLVQGELLGLKVYNLIIIVAALAIMISYDQFLRRTLYGRAIRATAVNSDVASLMGIGTRSVIVVSFLISGVITALAGLLAAPVIFIEPGAGLVLTIKGFVAIVIGGIGSARGALVGGLIVGILDSMVRNLVSASIGNMVVFAVLALILVVFPSGLFGKPLEGH